MKRILNEYTIVADNVNADIIAHVFYLSPNKCRVVTRQFDQQKVENVVLTIGNESFDIKVSTTVDITLQNTILGEEPSSDIPQRIPKIIFQTSTTFPQQIPECIKNLIDFNPEYEYRFFDDTKRRAFLKSTFSQQVVDAYDLLISGAFKADLFRYAYLFIHGGCYFDDKIIARVPLSKIIEPEDDLILCRDVEKESILNAIIFAEPRNFLFLKLLLTACDNILSGQTTSNMLELTGPKLMYKVFNEHVTDKNFKMKHHVVNEDFNYYKNFEILLTKNDEVAFTKTTPEALQRFLTDPNHYRQLWNRGEIFYKQKTSLYNLSIYIHPHPYVDTFKFTIDSHELTIERADGVWWHFNLRLKIVDEDTNSSILYDVGLNRTIPLTLLNLPPHASFSHSIDITSLKKKSLIFYDISSFKKHKKESDESTILVLTEHMRNSELNELNSDYIILFTGSDAVFYCKEKDERTKILYITETILKQLKEFNTTVKLCFNNKIISIPPQHVERLEKNCKLLYKKNLIDLETFFQSYEEFDVASVCNEMIQKNKSLIEDLNQIIQQTGESLEGNIFYEHLSKNFVLNKDWDCKRCNMFYYSRLSVDIMEIGFNAGHSGLLYLLSNNYSSIQFFDLGEHKYSRPCFEYLNAKFPNRLNVVWGDSTITIPRSFGAVFDFIHIDGGHSRYVAESDFHNSKPFASNNCLVIIDDTDGNILDTLSQQLIKYNKFQQRELLFPTKYHMLGVYSS